MFSVSLRVLSKQMLLTAYTGGSSRGARECWKPPLKETAKSEPDGGGSWCLVAQLRKLLINLFYMGQQGVDVGFAVDGFQIACAPDEAR
jgi:hypothetical protein